MVIITRLRARKVVKTAMIQELKLLLKQRSVSLLLLLSLSITWLSLWNGWHTIAHIHQQISLATEDEKIRHAQQLSDFTSHGEIEAGEVGYYVFHHVYNEPDAWSFIALGNRLVTPTVQRIRLLGLQGQLYDGESHHPEFIILGSFDYAFWLVFFAPLLCITLMHDIKASEHQAKRLMLLNSLTPNATYFWTRRILIRWCLIVMTLLFPVYLFAIMQKLSFAPLIRISVVTIVYTLFWTCICLLTCTRRNAFNASSNAMLLACIWLVLTIILPNIAQHWLHQRYPVQEGSQVAIQHRQLVHQAWDLPKTDTLSPFYKLYPAWQNTPPVVGRFHWKWYFAFQHMADVNLSVQVQARENALLARDYAISKLPLPSVWVQQTLENSAKSNVQDLIRHRHHVLDFHSQLRHYLYPFLFKEKRFTSVDFLNMPKYHQLDSSTLNASRH